MSLSTRRTRYVLPAILLLCAPAFAQVTQRVSVSNAGVEVGQGGLIASISDDGRYVAFDSFAGNLVPGDTNGKRDVFVRDRQAGTTTLVSISSTGTQGGADSGGPVLSGDGRYVAFWSRAAVLVPDDTNVAPDVFVHDRQTGTTIRVSVDSAGVQGNDDSYPTSISSDGRYVAFTSLATNLVPGDTTGAQDAFVHDLVTGSTIRVSVDSNGAGGQGGPHGSSFFPKLSGDGRYVVFESEATNLVPGDTNGVDDIFLHDLQTGTTSRVSVDSTGAQGNGASAFPSLTADGRYVSFASVASNLVAGDVNGFQDIFVRDLQTGTTSLASLNSLGEQGNHGCAYSDISDDGRYVAFESYASNFAPSEPTGLYLDIFVRDLQTGTTSCASFGYLDEPSDLHSSFPVVSSDGRYVAFNSAASNLVPWDYNLNSDVFVRDTMGGPTFTSLCDPGVAGVRTCPCGNPPSGVGRGCDNSATTGGAILSASGGTFLSSDSLVFTTTGEKLTATSILLQGTTVAASGVVYGQGVRCLGGTLKRLFVKTAFDGSILAPDFDDNDPSVSSRSAAFGNPISPGESRWYLVFYRDPHVLGGCPSGSTFNATQTGRIDWAP